MFTSVKYSYFAVRLGLAIVFFWFGIDKFIHPTYWLNAWVPPWFLDFLTKTSISGTQYVYINGIFEVLVAISLILGIFTKFFSTLAIIFLTAILIVNGFTEVTVRDIGLVGGFLAVLFWPAQRDRF